MRPTSLSIVLLIAVASGGWTPAVAGDGSAFGPEAWTAEVARRGVDPAVAVYPFASTPEMVAWAEEKVGVFRNLGAPRMLEALQNELFYREQFDFTYEDDLTLTAIEAFEAQRGNCMAFTSLFVSLSRGLGIPTFLVSVRRAPEIEKDNGLVVVNRHVVAGYRGPDKLHLYDFYVTSDSPYIRHWIIDDVQASAMYHTNRGGSAIRNDDYESAIHHLEIATRLDPTWAPGWVNLGVAHFRRGEIAVAMEAYQQALRVDPDNSSALTNMAVSYRAMGQPEEARAALLAAVAGQTNPYTLIALADIEMSHGRLDQAERFLRKAKWGFPDLPEVYDALARLARRRGNEDEAFRHSGRAAKLRQRIAAERSVSPHDP